MYWYRLYRTAVLILSTYSYENRAYVNSGPFSDLSPFSYLRTGTIFQYNLHFRTQVPILVPNVLNYWNSVLLLWVTPLKCQLWGSTKYQNTLN